MTCTALFTKFSLTLKCVHVMQFVLHLIQDILKDFLKRILFSSLHLVLLLDQNSFQMWKKKYEDGRCVWRMKYKMQIIDTLK